MEPAKQMIRINPHFNNLVEKTTSEKIEDRLKELSVNLGKPFSIENRGSPVEIYHFGIESASLIKQLVNGTVGEEGGEMHFFAESSEVYKYEWWKIAIDKLPIKLLEISIDQLIAEYYPIDSRIYLVPKEVVKYYKLNPKGSSEEEIACIQWVKDKIFNMLSPLLAPQGFKMVYIENRLRLKPLNTQSSLQNDRKLYDKASLVIYNTLEQLQKIYQAMSIKRNNA